LQHDTSPALRDLPPAPAGLPDLLPLYTRPVGDGLNIPQPLGPDPVWQRAPGGGPAMLAPLLSFEGVNNVNGVAPPDTNGDVGPDHYVQWVNLSFAIWDKNGTLLSGPHAGNTLWSGFGGVCETTNHGDPIALYDREADRWLMSQFSLNSGNYHQCIAISQTGDPTGAWYRYDFLMSNTKMNDYPKFGVWPDGYYMSINQFRSGAWSGAGAVAFERDKMLAGLPAQMVYFDMYDTIPELGGMLPADLDGTAQPPAGTPNYFMQFDDNAWGYSGDQLQLWTFSVDWDAPANSTFTLLNTLPTAAFDSNLCSYAACIPQPGTTQRLDPLSDRLMYRLHYRHFADLGYQTMVVNHAVDVDGANHAGIRWYELRDTGGGWSIHQQGTYAPDALHRWMGSAAMDASGNIALGYSASSSSNYPSIRYTGRFAGDPLGTMTQDETTLHAGGGSQTATQRWGDYSMLTLDPTDDCTFWYTQEYYQTTSSVSWRTRIGSFRFPYCSGSPSGTLEGVVTDAVSGLPITDARVTNDIATTFTDAAGAYQFRFVPPNSYTVTVSAYGYLLQTITNTIVISQQTTIQNFALTPLTVVTVTGIVTDAGHGWPLYARLDVAADNYANSLFTDPATGVYTIPLIADTPHNFTVSAAGYNTEIRPVLPLTPTHTENFSLTASAACDAPGYGDPGCTPLAGGLVIGNVYDANTGSGLNEAAIADTTASFATPDDPALADGFYILFAPSGPQTLTATKDQYGSDTRPVNVIANSVISQNFYLPAGQLVITPTALTVTLPLNQLTTHTLALQNSGGLTAMFDLFEINVPLTNSATAGSFAPYTRRLSPKRLSDGDAQAVYDPDLPIATPLAAGQISTIWSSDLAGLWGMGEDASSADSLWLSNSDSLQRGDSQVYRFLADGTNTAESLDISAWEGDWAADLAYNPLTGSLWQVNVGGDNCIHEVTSGGSKICPAFGVSQRGLAYDPTTDTFYSGSWNDAIIYHFDADGTLLDSKNVGLNIAGLAFNPATGHLFTAVNSGAGFDIYVLDVHNNYAIVGGFDIAGLGSYQQAGLALDCTGLLWAANSVAKIVIAATSGESGVCDWAEIPWLTELPPSGTVAVTETAVISLTFDATALPPATYQGHLRITHDTPYAVTPVAVTLIVTGSGYAPALTPPSLAQAGPPGAVVTYTLAASNRGVLSDTFALDLGPHAWATTITPTLIGPLEPGATAAITAAVSIAADGLADTVTVTLTSQGDPTQVAAAILTTTATTVGGPVISPTISLQSGLPGSTVVHVLQITNPNAITDAYDLSANHSWPVTLPAAAIGPLAGGGNTPLTISVTLPLTAPNGAGDVALLTVTSRLNTTQAATATLMTVSRWPKLYLPVILH
jgi:hypothetical protein